MLTDFACLLACTEAHIQVPHAISPDQPDVSHPGVYHAAIASALLLTAMSAWAPLGGFMVSNPTDSAAQHQCQTDDNAATFYWHVDGLQASILTRQLHRFTQPLRQ